MVIAGTSLCIRWSSPMLPNNSVRTFSANGRARPAVAALESPVMEEPNIPCDTCQSKGWIVCDFCNGQKTNVQVRNKKFYRRCPSCRAAGVLFCSKCKVFKCVTFPDGKDGSFEM